MVFIGEEFSILLGLNDIMRKEPLNYIGDFIRKGRDSIRGFILCHSVIQEEATPSILLPLKGQLESISVLSKLVSM